MRIRVLYSLAATASLFLTAGNALADPASLPAGGQSAFSPSAETVCFGAVTNNSARPTASAQAECLFDSSSVWARVAANSGAGSEAVDIAAETTIIVGHFQVETPEGAAADGFLPVHVMVPVGWGGALANAQAETGASADINMYLRLREADAADPTLAGNLVSQSRFQGATHGGVGACASLPAGTVSAAAMVIGCAEGVVQQDTGAAVAELAGVVRTNQPYVIELVAHAAIASSLAADAAEGAEDVNFFSDPDVETAPAGLSWSADASVAIGTDANELVGDVRDELEDLKDEVADLQQQLAMLRWDFEGHYHTYLTGRGVGHNNTVAETPPPSLPPPMPMPAEEESGSVTAPPSTSTVSGSTSSSNLSTARVPTQNQQTQEGGGALGWPLLLLLSGFALLRARLGLD